jgi:hypothetical protein
MMRRLFVILTLSTALGILSGCGSKDGGEYNPKIQDPSKVDPKLKRAQAGDGGNSPNQVNQPQQATPTVIDKGKIRD